MTTSGISFEHLAITEDVIGHLLKCRRTEYEISHEDMTDKELQDNLDEAFALAAAKCIITKEIKRIVKNINDGGPCPGL